MQKRQSTKLQMLLDALAVLQGPLLLSPQVPSILHKPWPAAALHALQMVAKAADALSVGDQVTRRVRQYQNWSLMPFAAVSAFG